MSLSDKVFVARDILKGVSGFCLGSQKPGNVWPKVVDFAGMDRSGEFTNSYVSARWCSSSDSTQRYVRTTDDGLLFIEGQPDRLPNPAQTAEQWLDGRSGSFRGFEITADTVTLFVDPLGTRPIYLFKASRCWFAADKLASVSANQHDATMNWPAVLEVAMTGSVQMPGDTTLTHTRELKAGECLRIDFRTGQSRSRRFSLPEVDIGPVRQDPAGTLLRALELAVRDTWNDDRTWLLASGGLDSRLTMALAGPGRRALTINHYPAETPIAAQVGAVCGAAEFHVHEVPSQLFPNMVRNSPLVTGAMLDADFVNYLGLGWSWRRQGIGSVAHAFLFDTVLKGWLARRAADIEPIDLLGLRFTGARALSVGSIGRGWKGACHDIVEALTPDGVDIARQRIRAMTESVSSVVEDGIETGFEQHVLAQISRQVHYGFLLGLYDETDVVSPIFHPAIWSWYRASTVADRWQGCAIKSALLRLNHPVSAVPDANTGEVVTEVKRSWRDFIRDTSIYRLAVRPIWRRLHSSPADVQIGNAHRLRGEQGRRNIEEGCQYLADNPLIRTDVALRYLAGFSAGDDRFYTSAVALMNIGRWTRIVTEGAGAMPAPVPIEQSRRAIGGV